LALDVPLLAVDHLQGHVASLFLTDAQPKFPFLCLTVSGGHTQLDRVDGPLAFTCLGSTRDDAAGEAFDKAAKLLGLPYPGGPAIDRLAETGDPTHHSFPALKLQGYEFSFSGVKTHLLYHLRTATAQDPNYLLRHRADLCASLRHWVVQTLLGRFWSAAEAEGIDQLAIVGGVSANRLLRHAFEAGCAARGYAGFIPPIAYCTDNAAMIARSGLFQLDAGQLANQYAEAFPTGSHAAIG
jgi:N6-L-threonylcarbamoyladenine synthase